MERQDEHEAQQARLLRAGEAQKSDLEEQQKPQNGGDTSPGLPVGAAAGTGTGTWTWAKIRNRVVRTSSRESRVLLLLIIPLFGLVLWVQSISPPAEELVGKVQAAFGLGVSSPSAPPLLAQPPSQPHLSCWQPRPQAQDAHSSADADAGDQYLLGVGKADITGPVVEINLMGYADPSQVGSGLRQRLYSRAFVVADMASPEDRIVYVVLDTQSGDTAVRYGIVEALRALGPAYAAYGHHNVAVTGTHSHSGPGGWLNYLLPQITSKGFDRQGYRAIVDGAVLSIRRAHEALAPGYLSVAATRVADASINRSLFAYMANPAAERARYNSSETDVTDNSDDGSVERELTLLKLQRASDMKNIGVLTWFPTHGTSMLGNNTLISGDNKGVAAYLFERHAGGGDDPTAAEGFVAGFSQASVGDTSPNVLGAWCEDGSGRECSLENSTCPGDGGRARHCHGRGPFFGRDDGGAASCFEIGRRQFEPARALYDELNRTPRPVRGGWVRSFHTFHNMSGFEFPDPFAAASGPESLSNAKGQSESQNQSKGPRLLQTCPAALGYSFAAGTSDGPGVFDFTQHDGGPGTTSPVWQAVSRLLKEPSPEQRECHGAKPILLDVGEVDRPYQWTPNVVDVQVLRVGQLVIVVSPGEATTMAGRRWKDAVSGAYAALFRHECYDHQQGDASAPEPVVVLGGPANTYTHYITTEEEYGVQRYEGASTLYGPHTLAAYVNVTLSFLPYLSAHSSWRHQDRRPPHGPFPPDNSNRSLSFITGVIRDAPPLLHSFGDVLVDVPPVVRRAQTPAAPADSVRAVFVAANPRNDLRLERTYAAVEKLDFTAPGRGRLPKPRWRVVRDDADWSLVFHWRRKSSILATSEAEVVWEIESWAEPGVYRLRYFGDAKSLGGTITPIEGTSGTFTLV